MIKINENDYGTISVEDNVLSNLIYEEIQKMSPYMFVCTKQGKSIVGVYKLASEKFIHPVEIDRRSEGVSIKFYVIVRFGESIKSLSNIIFDRIEEIFDMFSLDKPTMITMHVKGIYSKQISPRNSEIVRRYDSETDTTR